MSEFINSSFLLRIQGSFKIQENFSWTGSVKSQHYLRGHFVSVKSPITMNPLFKRQNWGILLFFLAAETTTDRSDQADDSNPATTQGKGHILIWHCTLSQSQMKPHLWTKITFSIFLFSPQLWVRHSASDLWKLSNSRYYHTLSPPLETNLSTPMHSFIVHLYADDTVSYAPNSDSSSVCLMVFSSD